jgi:hypothetical protein
MPWPPHDDVPRDAWSTLKREALIAAQTAAVITVVLLVRRWTAALLGGGLLDEEVLSESTVVSDLMAQLELRARTREEKTHRDRPSRPQRQRTAPKPNA